MRNNSSGLFCVWSQLSFLSQIPRPELDRLSSSSQSSYDLAVIPWQPSLSSHPSQLNCCILDPRTSTWLCTSSQRTWLSYSLWGSTPHPLHTVNKLSGAGNEILLFFFFKCSLQDISITTPGHTMIFLRPVDPESDIEYQKCGIELTNILIILFLSQNNQISANLLGRKAKAITKFFTHGEFVKS